MIVCKIFYSYAHTHYAQRKKEKENEKKEKKERPLRYECFEVTKKKQASLKELKMSATLNK